MRAEMSASGRETGIEAARVTACLVVICCHVLPYVIDGMDGGSFGVMFLRTLCADGVGIFWLISGMFLFSGRKYASLLRRTARRIALPLVLISFAVFFARGFRFEDRISYSLPEAGRFISLLRSFLSLRNGVPGLDYLWFLYTYLWIIFLYPVMNVIVSIMDGDRKRMAGVLAAILLLLLLNDLAQNGLCSFSHDAFHAVFAATLFVIAGHFFDRFRHEWVQRAGTRSAYLFFSAAIVIDLLRTIILSAHPGTEHLLYWFTLPGMLVSMSLLCAFMKLFGGRSAIVRPRMYSYVSRLSSASFGIYLIHGFLIHALVRIDAFSHMFVLIPKTFARFAAYPVTFFASMIVFLLCYWIVSLSHRALSIVQNRHAK